MHRINWYFNYIVTFFCVLIIGLFTTAGPVSVLRYMIENYAGNEMSENNG